MARGGMTERSRLDTNGQRTSINTPLAATRRDSIPGVAAIMTDAERAEALTAAANHIIDLPGIPEAMEGWMLRPIVDHIVPHIPEGAWPYIVNASDGIDAAERKQYANQVTQLVLDALFSGLPQFARQVAEAPLRPMIQRVADAIFEYAQSGKAVAMPGAA